MRRSITVLTAAALVALTGCGAATAAARVDPTRPAVTLAAATSSTVATVTTTGMGTVSGTPDVMTVQIGVETTAAHVGAALRANNARGAALQAALERHGVAVADIQTAQLSLYPQQGRNGVTGYQVSDVVSATLHDLSTAGAVIDDALAAAGDAGRLEGVSFSVADDSVPLAQARRQAVSEARAEARQLAAAAGLRVVGLRSITDQADQGGIPQFASSAGAAAGAAQSVPVQPGTEQTTAQVVAVWNVAG